MGEIKTKPRKLKAREGRLLRTRGEKVVLWITFVFFLIYAATLLYPFLYLLINSFKEDFMEMMDNPLGLPEKWFFSNYTSVFEDFQIGSMFFNSVTLTLGNTVVSMMMSCMAAYVLSKYRFKGNEFIYTAVIVASMIPTTASLAATFRLMNDLRLTDTYIGMIMLQGGAFGGAFLYLHAYFKGIPWSYAESAMLDGASDLRVFFVIMIPLARKGIMTFTIIRFLGFWNDYWLPSLFYSEHPTLAVGLSEISAIATGTADYPRLFAAMIIVILPILVFFAIFQKQLMGNTIGGGLKE